MAEFKFKCVDPLPESLKCHICSQILRDPHVTICCGKRFCRSCISRYMNNGKPCTDTDCCLCPLCKEPGFTTFPHKGVAREVNALKVYCPHKSQGCDWQGELGQVEKHLNPEDEHGNGCFMVECKYRCGGWFQKQIKVLHETEECPKRPIEEQLSCLARKFNLLADENRARLEECKRESDTAIQLIKEDCEAEIAALKQENKTRLSALETENRQLKEQLRIHSPPTPVPPFYFTVYSYKYQKECKATIISPPFYSYPGGYKMELSINPNGFATGCNTHLSVFVRVLKGEYDDTLQWPFIGKVFIEIYKHMKKEWSHAYCIDFEGRPLANNQRPIETRACISYGHREYLAHSEVETHHVIENTVRFRVSRVEF